MICLENLTPQSLLGSEVQPELQRNRSLLEETVGLVEGRRKLLLEKIKLSDSGCWEWTGSLNYSGYGIISNHIGKKLRVHRLIYSIMHGLAENSAAICHHCDNRKCCNPSHLFKGIQSDNMKDMMRKGRNRFGDNCPWAVLKEIDIVEIRSRRSSGESLKSLSADFGIGVPMVSQIANRLRWKHVP